jgi:hypothetical protein
LCISIEDTAKNAKNYGCTVDDFSKLIAPSALPIIKFSAMAGQPAGQRLEMFAAVKCHSCIVLDKSDQDRTEFSHGNQEIRYHGKAFNIP